MLSRDPRQGSLFDLSDRVKLRISGADRIRFVNGQITNDVRKATSQTAVAACVLSAKGKMNAHLFVSVRDDCLFVDTDPQAGELLTLRFQRYIISDDVQIEDVTDQFSIFHVLTKTIPPVPGSLLSIDRFRKVGWDLWVAATQHDQTAQALSTLLPLCDPDCAEVFRIEEGIPVWGKELTEEIIPIEADLERTCIDYGKGCYIGQEVISRMKMSGQRNKGLFGFVPIGDTSLAAGMRLHGRGDKTKEVGWITSATWSERLHSHIALGFVKRPFDHVEAELDALAGSAPVPVKVAGLPLVKANQLIN